MTLNKREFKFHKSNLAKWQSCKDLTRHERRKRYFNACLKLFLLVIMIPGVLYALVFENDTVDENLLHQKKTVQNQGLTKVITSPPDEILNKIPLESFNNLKEKTITIPHDNSVFQIETTLELDLQNYLLDQLDTRTAKYIAIVVMEPVSGRILAMVGFDKYRPDNNPCLDNDIPAASVFKIVTAAAAVETCGFNKDTILKYNGKKHTLYKSQLKDITNKWTRNVTLEKSFAESINPVFGKLGAHCLRKSGLKTYAEAFGFNKDLEFDLGLKPSRFAVSDDPYNWSEIASGFNRQTTLSPLHSAIMASIIVNDGTFVAPFLIENIKDSSNKTIFEKRQTESPLKVLHPDTSNIVFDLMKATVKSGTGKKAFRGRKKDKTLSRLEIGGKTGSIDNKDHSARIDWFTGFARELGGEEKLALGVVVAHEKFIGVRANRYARKAISFYFKNFFTKQQKSGDGSVG